MATATAKIEPLVNTEPSPIKPAAARIDEGFVNRQVVIFMPEEISVDYAFNNPRIFRLLTLNEDDRVELRWRSVRAYTAVDYAEPGEGITFLKPDIKHKRDRDRVPWTDGKFEVRPVDGQWSYFRVPNKGDPVGIRATTASWGTWQAAQAACLRDEYPRKIG
jgi:hypothetical protein